MKLNLLSLAPDSFIFGPSNLLSQFYPKKIFDILNTKQPCGVCSSCGKAYNSPWGMEIHLTSNCQLGCLHCSYGNRNKDYCELSAEILKKILTSVKSCGRSLYILASMYKTNSINSNNIIIIS